MSSGGVVSRKPLTSSPSRRCAHPGRSHKSTYAAATVAHRVSFAFDGMPDWARSLERFVLHSSKWKVISTAAMCSQYSASARSFQLWLGLYAACWRHREPIARRRLTFFIASPHLGYSHLN